MSGPRALAALAVAAALLVACSDDDDRSSSSTTSVPGAVVLAPEDDIYALAEPLVAGEPGALIASQEVPDPGVDARVYRVLYHSRSIQGDDIAVSGIVAIPDGPVPEDGRPILSWAHGTTGIADECAPSKDPPSAGIARIAPFFERGMVFAATDYEGLGTPGRHPYLVGESEGRGVLDIVRAARQLDPQAGRAGPVVLWGHSQGAHAVLFANQIADEYAPALDVVGTVAGAPPSQLVFLSQALRDSPFQFYLGMVAAGWAAAHPDADPADLLTAEGLRRLDDVDGGCAGSLATSWNDVPYDELIKAEPGDVKPWDQLLIDNDPGFTVGASPVLIIHGEQDEQIPAVSSELLVARMCGVDQDVQRRTYPGNHAGVIAPSLADMLRWIDERLAGDPAASDCA